MEEENVHERIQKLLVTGDNRLKQGVDPAKARESWEQALALAREAGLEQRIRPLVEVRLADHDEHLGDCEEREHALRVAVAASLRRSPRRAPRRCGPS